MTDGWDGGGDGGGEIGFWVAILLIALVFVPFILRWW